ncbi:MAG TPA: L,D-transpeptidase [Chlamydiales bacterium]|nr:L,D-transpeptidase [Chlamydiales bacterium]
MKVKYFILGAGALFATIGYMGYRKKEVNTEPEIAATEIVQEIDIAPKPQPAPTPILETTSVPAVTAEIDRIPQLFTLDSSKLPIVETISYTSRVPWLKGRPAWISDYASHYETSRHFIARSLNKKADYFTQKVGPGDKFNIFKKDAKIQFHLLIDLAKAKMRFYYIDLATNERTLLKTYKVGLGRADTMKKSGYLTPIGKYELGNRIAIYKPGTMGFFQDKKTEMIRIFGTRWIPFEKEIDGCSEPAKGLGLHGTPWIQDLSGTLIEDRAKIGKYDSDGCVRLAQEDMEELFSIIITKPTTVELVRSFEDAKLPGVEK